VVAKTPERSRRRQPARRGQGAALRAEIIDAASRELARSGEAGTLTLRGLARTVGVATTSIYLHFANIEELLFAVKLARVEEFDAALAEAAEAAGADPYQRVRARAHAYVDFALANRGEYAVMFAAQIYAEDGPPPEVGDQQSLKAIAEDVARAMSSSAQAISAQPISAETAWMCALHLWTGMHGMLMLRRSRPHLPWPDLNTELDDLVARIIGRPAA
jgi:AcrR family transcriptional regulator